MSLSHLDSAHLELTRMRGAIRSSIEELLITQNYSQVEMILREVDRRMEPLLHSIDVARAPMVK